MSYPAMDITNFKFNDKTGTVTITYLDGKIFKSTIGEISANPLKRVPLFNILRSDSGLKKVVEKFLDTYLGWRVTFYVKGDIDMTTEAKKWRQNLGMASSKARDVTSGVRARQ